MGWLTRTATNFLGRSGTAELERPGIPRAGSVVLSVLADHQLHSSIGAALTDLKAASVELERQFGATCNTLSQLSDRGRALVTGSERLVEIASGKRSGLKNLLEGMSLVEPPLAFLASYRDRFNESRLLERLTEDRSAIDECVREEAAIGRIMEPLRTVNTLFKVVAAPLGEQVQTIFSSLVEELGELMESMDQIIGVRFADLERVRKVLHAMIGQMVEQQSHWDELAAQRATMQKTLRELEGQLQANSKRDTRIGAASRRIADAIEQVVTGLQWQDIINQKVEHSSTAIGALVTKLRSGSIDAGFVNRAARLETAQINVARRELAEAEHAIVEGIERVREILSQSDASAVMLGEFQLLTTSSTGMVQLLLESIESVDSQLDGAVRTSSESMRTIREIGESAKALTDAVRELSERTLLVGLNAQVQACKVQQGAGLGVLSARTSDISGEIAVVGTSVAKKLDQIVGDLSECAAIFATLLAEAEAQKSTFVERRAAVEESMHTVRDEALSLVTATGDSIERIDAMGALALKDARYQVTLAGPFETLLGLLERIVDASGGADIDLASGDESLTDAFKSYTMASEREVFAAVGAGAAAAAASVKADDASIELFGDEPVSQTASPSAEPNQPSKSDPQLGENVELF